MLRDYRTFLLFTFVLFVTISVPFFGPVALQKLGINSNLCKLPIILAFLIVILFYGIDLIDAFLLGENIGKAFNNLISSIFYIAASVFSIDLVIKSRYILWGFERYDFWGNVFIVAPILIIESIALFFMMAIVYKSILVFLRLIYNKAAG